MRLERWQAPLIASLESMEREPHVYSQSDCIMRTALNAVAILHERDLRRAEILVLLGRYRGTYASFSGALRILRKDGLTPLSLVTRFFPEIKPGKASGGDIGAVRAGKHLSFGTFSGPHIYVSVDGGMGILPRTDAVKAFRVV